MQMEAISTCHDCVAFVASDTIRAELKAGSPALKSYIRAVLACVGCIALPRAGLAALVDRHLDINVDDLNVFKWLVKAVCLGLLNHLHDVSALHYLQEIMNAASCIGICMLAYKLHKLADWRGQCLVTRS